MCFRSLLHALCSTGQEILDDVAKPFDANPQRVKPNLRPVAQGTGVQFPRRSPALQSQMLEYRASRPNARRPQRKRLAPLPPLLAIEFFQRRASFVLLLDLPSSQNLKQRVRRGITAAPCGAGALACRLLPLSAEVSGETRP